MRETIAAVPSSQGEIAVADEVEDLLFEDGQSGPGEDVPPLSGGADLLIAQLVEQVVLQRGGRVATEPVGILKAKLAYDKQGATEPAAQFGQQTDQSLRVVEIFVKGVAGSDAIDRAEAIGQIV